MMAEILMLMGEVLIAVNVIALPYLAVVWVVFAVVTGAGSARSRAHARSGAEAAPRRNPAVSALSWPARAAAFRTALLLLSTVVVFVTMSANSSAGTPPIVGEVMFAVAAASMCAFDVFTVVSLIRFGDLIADVFEQRTVAGRDARLAYAMVMTAFAVPAVLVGIGLSL